MDDTLTRWLHLLSQNMPSMQDQYSVSRIWLFGPAARGRSSTGVLDILAASDHTPTYSQFTELQNHLSELLGIKVELVIKGALDPAIEELVYSDIIPVSSAP